MLKCATEREKDRLDTLELINRFNINWSTIIEESISQSKIGGYVYPFFLFDFLSELKEDMKADIPTEAIRKIRRISEEIMLKKIKSGKKFAKSEFFASRK